MGKSGGGEDDGCGGSAVEDERNTTVSSDSTTTSEEQSTRSCSDETESLPDVVDAERTINADEMEAKKPSKLSEIEMVKERFAKLLLGEDMSGCGKGVSTALAISNAITNLFATIFGQVWRLEPLPSQKEMMWRREMDWLLCVSDHIVEFAPTWQTLADGSKLEVMTCRPRSDLYMNLPALKKLDNMLLEILDSFRDNTEFWYIEQGIVAPESNCSSSLCRSFPQQQDKWWLPLPRLPSCGLQEKTRKHLEHKRESANQILKAVLAINSNTLADMDIPDSYLESLPKNGKASLGDLIHRYITSDQFSPDCLLDCLDLSSEHQALEIANRVEAAIFIWRRRTAATRSISQLNRTAPRPSWGMVKDFMGEGEKRELLADRAESLLICLKQRFPCLTQTSLDMSKIQYNKDIGKSILESYSRVLESLAFNIVARIDDVLSADDLAKHSDKLALVPAASIVAHKRVTIPYSVPPSSTPYATAYTTPCFSPTPLSSLDRSPIINRRSNHNSRGFGVKKVLTDYLGADAKSRMGNGQGKTLEDRLSWMKLTTGEESAKSVD